MLVCVAIMAIGLVSSIDSLQWVLLHHSNLHVCFWPGSLPSSRVCVGGWVGGCLATGGLVV